MKIIAWGCKKSSSMQFLLISETYSLSQRFWLVYLLSRHFVSSRIQLRPTLAAGTKEIQIVSYLSWVMARVIGSITMICLPIL